MAAQADTAALDTLAHIADLASAACQVISQAMQAGATDPRLLCALAAVEKVGFLADAASDLSGRGVVVGDAGAWMHPPELRAVDEAHALWNLQQEVNHG